MRAFSVAAVTLDAYGTLFEGGSDDLIAILRDLHGRSGAGATLEDLLTRREALIAELEQRDFMTMRARDDWILRTLFQEYDIDGDPEQHVAKLYETYFQVKPYPDAVACLDGLRARGVKVGLVSNADVDMMKAVLHKNGLLTAFDAVVTSEAAHAYKPSAAIFESAARSLGVKPSEVLHVGDSFVADVVGAKRAGMHAAWLARPGGLPPPKKREARPDLKLESLTILPSRVAPQS